MQELPLTLIVFKLQDWYEGHSPDSFSEFNRLYWLDDGRGMAFFHPGLDRTIPQYNHGGWLLIFDDLYLVTFLANNPKYAEYTVFDRTGQPAYIPMTLELSVELNELVRNLADFIARGKSHEFLQAGISMILIVAMQAYANGNVQLSSTDLWSSGKMHKLNLLLRENYKTAKPTQFYASELGVTAKKLNQLCKAAIQRNVRAELNRMRVGEAKRLMLFSGMPVKEISTELGFETVQNFSTFFKKMTGLSPTAYIKQVNG